MRAVQKQSISPLKLDVTAVETAAEENGVHIEIDPDSECLWISRIDRLTGIPGSGGRAIEHLFEVADEYGLPVGLCCQDGYLVEYYEALGFEIDNDATRCSSDDDMVLMQRQPQD